MLKNWMILLITLLPLISNAQQVNVDSLKKVLPTLKGRPRIDCLNELSEYYYWIRTDSAAWYATKALEESSAIRYQKGIDVAWFSIGLSKINSYDHVEGERLMRRSLTVFEGTDSFYTGWSMLHLSGLLIYRCQYDESIRLLEGSIPILKVHDKPGGDGVGKALTLLGLAYGAKGDYETGLDRAQKSYKERKRTGDPIGTAWSLLNLGGLYGQVGDNETAFNYYHQALRLFQTSSEPVYLYSQMARLFNNTNRLDSARFYINKALKISQGYYGDVVSGEIDLNEGQYDKAIPKFQKSMAGAAGNNGREEVLIDLLNLSRAFAGNRAVQKSTYLCPGSIPNCAGSRCKASNPGCKLFAFQYLQSSGYAR